MFGTCPRGGGTTCPWTPTCIKDRDLEIRSKGSGCRLVPGIGVQGLQFRVQGRRCESIPVQDQITGLAGGFPGSRMHFSEPRFWAKREQLGGVQGLLPRSQGQNLALTVLHVPHSLESGMHFDQLSFSRWSPTGPKKRLTTPGCSRGYRGTSLIRNRAPPP